MYFIAEIGVNHNGCVNLAKEMIDAAKKSGADCVKFQSFDAKKLARKTTPKVEYQKNEENNKETHFEMLSRLQFSKEQIIEVYKYCKEIDIDFISTPYDVDSAKSLHKLGCKVFKTASADIVDFQLHNYLSSSADKVIISLGMANLGEIEDVLSLYAKSTTEIILLHCISNYPCSDESVNINNIITLKSAFHHEVGFSDHTIGNVASVMSICYGANLIEKHFTLDKNLSGPDHAASSTPEEFYSLVNECTRAKKMLGSSIKRIQKEEISMRDVSRKSIYAAEDISLGSIIEIKHLSAIRPGNGLSPMLIPKIVGTKAKSIIKKGDLLKFGDFGED
tara:strand:+ start:1617 stop:2621 length:1005 start_codon:yes stop_codon:yes gene_type:complete